MNNYKENHIQLFNQYKDSCDSEIIEYLRTEGKHNYTDFVNARNNELNIYPKLTEFNEALTRYNNIYGELFRQIVMLYHYTNKYSNNNNFQDNGAYLNAFHLTQIKIEELLKNIQDKRFVINHYLLENRRTTAIYYQEYCLRVFDLFIDRLNDFEIQIQCSPSNELFNSTRQKLIDSIDIEKIKITKEKNISETLTSTRTNVEERIWFKVGILFAQGIPQKLYSKYKDEKYHFKKITLELGIKETSRNYISQTINNSTKSTSNDDKNIYKNYDKMEQIYNYCFLNKINICTEFTTQLNKNKPH